MTKNVADRYQALGSADVRRPEASAWKLYSLGIAANNKVVNSDILYVVPIESIQMQDGQLISNPFFQESEGWDGNDELYRTKVTTDAAIEAIWKGETNRRTAPDVRRGERVWLWRFADSDKFYWESAGMDDHLRKLETVVYGISGTPEESENGSMPNYGYHLEMSTHKGVITLQTSAKNGEFTTYAIQIDAKNGRITISDALGNNIHLDSQQTVIELENADRTIVRLQKQDIYINAMNNILMKADNQMTLSSKNVEILASEQLKIDSPKTLITGELHVQGKSTFDQKMTANGIESSAPIEGPSDTI